MIGFVEAPRDVVVGPGEEGVMEFTARLDPDSQVVCTEGEVTCLESNGLRRCEVEFERATETKDVLCEVRRNGNVVDTAEALLFVIGKFCSNDFV